MEEYKKKYEETEERAKNIYNSDPYNSIVRAVCEQIFPELKESEDERIRKEILYVIHQLDDNTTICGRNYDFQKWIAWLEKQGKIIEEYEDKFDRISCEAFDKGYKAALEKQGEQKPITDFSNLRTWKYIVDTVLTEKEGIGQYLDSPFTEELAKKLQKRFGNIEQMPIDNVEPKFKVGDKINMINRKEADYTTLTITSINMDEKRYICNQGSVIDFDKEKEWYKIEQKPAEWSEEDENYCLDVNAAVSDYFDEGYAEELKDWLKSLKEKVQPQPKREWSEKDENGLGDALWAVQQARSIAKDENEMGGLWYAEKWLKSLKERMKGENE